MKGLTGIVMKAWLMLVAVSVFSGCATPIRQQQENYRPTLPPAYTYAEPENGSIYQASQDVRLFEDVVARRVGDVITEVDKKSISGRGEFMRALESVGAGDMFLIRVVRAAGEGTRTFITALKKPSQ